MSTTTSTPRATKVAVCFPSASMVHADFALCLASLCMYSQLAGLDIVVVNTKSSIVAIARNNAVRRAQEVHADFMLFLDSDMKFPRNALVDLLRHDRDVVGATYSKRTEPFHPLGCRVPGSELADEGRLMRMKHLPTGCMLIRMSVFDELTKPYFRFDVDEATGGICGEDYVFCERVIGLGRDVWCDLVLSLAMGHLGLKEYRIEKHPGEPGEGTAASGDESGSAST